MELVGKDNPFALGSAIMDGLGLIVIHQHQNNSFYMLITTKEKTLLKMDYIDLNLLQIKARLAYLTRRIVIQSKEEDHLRLPQVLILVQV